jgi:hypothetical protein
MKTIYLIGFRGTSFRTEPFKSESLLIRAGHVGFAFEGDESRVFGFHPTAEAARAIGDDEAVLAWLRKLNTMPGTIQDDTAIFRRAVELAKTGARTTVWQVSIVVSDDEFQRIRNLTMLWYTEQKTFLYSFPPEELLPDRDNCATFPRRLGLPLLEVTGQLVFLIPKLAEQGTEWHPQEDDDDQSDD